MIPLGTVQGGRRKGRQKKRWEDNISDHDPTGHSTRREKERQAEKEMGRQHIGMDKFKVGRSPSKCWKRKMEKSGCPIILDAPTVIYRDGPPPDFSGIPDFFFNSVEKKTT